jgi:hypothetical protein
MHAPISKVAVNGQTKILILMRVGLCVKERRGSSLNIKNHMESSHPKRVTGLNTLNIVYHVR